MSELNRNLRKSLMHHHKANRGGAAQKIAAGAVERSTALRCAHFAAAPGLADVWCAPELASEADLGTCIKK
jgi:hypothetical protein